MKSDHLLEIIAVQQRALEKIWRECPSISIQATAYAALNKAKTIAERKSGNGQILCDILKRDTTWPAHRIS
jgi:hypothetical protein